MLSEEIRTAVRLIELGLGEIQNLGVASDFHHLPFQLLSSGIERLMKCHICFGFLEQKGRLPNFKELKKCGGRSGHDLLELHNEITTNYFQQTVPALKDDYDYITSNKHLLVLLELLSEFGKYSRYYNLDIVTGAEKPSRNVQGEWRIFETNVASEHQGIIDKLSDINTADYANQFINKQHVILLEKFIRGLSRQFTLGRLGKKAQQNSSVLMYFITLNDDKLGNRNYRAETTSYSSQKKTPKKRTLRDKFRRKFNSNYVSKKIKRSDFDSEWPFYSNEVIVECRYGHWCVVTIDGVDYALNGSAQGRYKLEHVHDAGMAILGVYIKPFIDMCFELWSDKKKL